LFFFFRWKRLILSQLHQEAEKKIFTPLNPTNVGPLTGAENRACPVKSGRHLTGIHPV